MFNGNASSFFNLKSNNTETVEASETVTYYVVRAKNGLYLNPGYTEPSLDHPLLFSYDIQYATPFATRTLAGKAVAAYSEMTPSKLDNHPVMTELFLKDVVAALEGAEILKVEKTTTIRVIPESPATLAR